ncbi:heparan-alpha-glucosaminide N-acetyltransferase domain-containing protein [Pseudonocardia sp. TRM90224]|uniref:heparan-alpha-glucosaminide N-acetyltransferase domain-containing protein n=1 Tax=Pseudonocardia sp. TRM90224 TaxID=2812678 RepID=UPI001E2EB3E5|nr:heparan-alpha-glucosaminide N-acetyltransferase domain-containing protein [Pseudonocardia sp. TRM90224]
MSAPVRDRLLGVDAARFVALVGMFATHILPLDDDEGGRTVVASIASGRSAALFAVLAGVGIALATGGARGLPDGRAHAGAGAGLLVRAVLVGFLGLWLGSLRPPVLVILAFYAVLFLVAVPLLRLPWPVLAVGAVVACVVTPVVSVLVRAGGPLRNPRDPTLLGLQDPAALAGSLLVTGAYPVLTWTTYLLAGLAIGRLDLRDRRVAVWLVGLGVGMAVLAKVTSAVLLYVLGGAAAFGAGDLAESRYGTIPTDTWWWLAVDVPHSGAPLDLAHTTGTAMAVLGVILLLARWSRAVVWPLAAAGGIPLTLYTVHVWTLTTFDTPPTLTSYLVYVVAALLIGIAVRAAGLRGPFEAVVALASRRARRMVVGPPERVDEGTSLR